MKTIFRYFILEAPLRLKNFKNVSLGILEDSFDRVFNRNDPLTPPMQLRLTSGNYWSARFYRSMGRKYFSYCQQYCRLQKNMHILDIGCGCGQIAVQFMHVLNSQGRYEGLDVNRSEIEWCQENISVQKSNFHFRLVHIFNQIYNPKGIVRAETYKFPFEKNSFDLIILISVFTHMIPREMENYIREISRVLKKNGSVFITMFLLNPRTLRYMRRRMNSIQFPNEYGTHRLLDATNPSCAVAYDELYFKGLLRKYKLILKYPIEYGSWRGKKTGWDYQDLVILTK